MVTLVHFRDNCDSSYRAVMVFRAKGVPDSHSGWYNYRRQVTKSSGLVWSTFAGRIRQLTFIRKEHDLKESALFDDFPQ